MKTKTNKLPKADRFDFMTKKDAFAYIRDDLGVVFSEQSVEQGFRDNRNDPETGIPHRRSDPDKAHATIFVRPMDILVFLQKSNTTDVDLTKIKAA
jgi:hypothetical protein